MIVQYYGILGMKKPGEGFFIIGTQRETIDESKMTIRANIVNAQREWCYHEACVPVGM